MRGEHHVRQKASASRLPTYQHWLWLPYVWRQVNYALQRTTLPLGAGSFAAQNAAVDSWSVLHSIGCGRSSRDSPSLASWREIRGDI